MSSMNTPPKDPHYWRTLGELADTDEFRAYLKQEFPAEDPESLGAFSRRRFIQLMGASMALASASGCWKEETIMPLANRPEGYIPGTPRAYATAMEFAGVAQPLLVTSYDGRPTKIEGNPVHPASGGTASHYAQAAILTMYDPDSSQDVVQRTGAARQKTTWDAFDAAMRDAMTALDATRGAGFVVLAEESDSPTLRDMRARLAARFPRMAWLEYEPFNRDAERFGTEIAFGEQLRVHPRLENAQVLVCFDDNLLIEHPESARLSREFAARRNPDGEMLRVYAIESRFTHTGAVADHRLPVRPTQVHALLLALQNKIASAVNRPVPGMGPVPTDTFFARPDVTAMLDAVAQDLIANRGHSVVTVGPHHDAETHALVARINDLLGNTGTTVAYSSHPSAGASEQVRGLKALAGAMTKGDIEMVLMLGGNPVYDTPADIDFAAALARVPTSVRWGLYEDETSAHCTWHIPATHFLESWTDSRTYDGTVCVSQPLIDPLYGGRSAIEVLARLANDDLWSGKDLVARTFNERTRYRPSQNWRKTVHDGYAANTARPAVLPRIRSFPASYGSHYKTDVANGSFEVVFAPDAHVYDGRFANNAWLQEMPDFLTKVAWDNPVLMGKATADMAGVTNGAVVTVELNGGAVELPVWIQPGLAPGVLVLTTGYGRTQAGHVGGLPVNGVAPVGFDVNAVRRSNAPVIATGASVQDTGRTYEIAATQDHHLIDATGMAGRAARLPQLVREANVDEYKKEPDFAKHVVEHPPLESLWTHHSYDGYAWGMNIDLNKCTGCNACVIACQAENNIPVVGKEQMLNGREMHWIRIDAYYSGDVEDPEVVHQPVTCHQCENAPCEQVCPFAATMHSDEGLNDMVYNRCAGTRYCMNNCPYKVRRFNFFNFAAEMHGNDTEVGKMKHNPEVTVRNRGVMEKCTYCVQRIVATRVDARNNNRRIQDGEITPACAQTCPTQAIVFGDLNDPDSRVSKLHAAARAYAMLAELNVRPRTQYLARVRNRNPELTETA